jgi:4a-hydroxytetrahydrobiopterin dehydratase
MGPYIQRIFQFGDFRQAFTFMASGAQLAEKNQHHPNWSNLYNEVNVIMTTDDKFCLSTFDIEFAQGLDLVYRSYPAPKGKITV